MLSRIKASFIHLLISTTIAFVVLLLVFFVWYPQPLWNTQGISAVLLILLGVDVALGPLITLIVFNPRKKSLKFDLAVIAAVQVAALLYGLHTVYVARPAYIVFNVDRFDVVTALDIDPDSAKRAYEAGQAGIPVFGPKLVAAKLPEDLKERQRILFSAVQGGPDLAQMPEHYVDYVSMRNDVLAKARPVEQLKQLNAMNAPQWVEFIAGLGRPESDLAYLPLRGKERDGAVLIDRHDGDVVKMVLLSPW